MPTKYRLENEVFVSGIPKSVAMQELMEYFGAFGLIQDARILTGKNMAIVKYKSAASAKSVLRQAEEEGIFFGWRELMVEKATSLHSGLFAKRPTSRAVTTNAKPCAIVVRDVPRFFLKLEEHAFWRRLCRYGEIRPASHIEGRMAYVEFASTSAAFAAIADMKGTFDVSITDVRSDEESSKKNDSYVKGSRVDILNAEMAAKVRDGPSA